MRISTTGAVPRLDLVTATRLWRAVLAEWRDLEFDDAGRITDRETGRSSDRVVLLEGRHGGPGAVYRVKDEATEVLVELDTAGPDELSGNVTGPGGVWSVTLETSTADLPAVTILLDGETTSLLTATDGVEVSGTARRWIDRYGGRGRVRASFDTAALAALSTAPATGDGEIRAGRFEAAATIRTEVADWQVDAYADLHPHKILPRLALLLFGRRLRTEADRALSEFWTGVPETMAEWRRELVDLRVELDAAGDDQALVHSRLWAPDGPLLGLRR